MAIWCVSVIPADSRPRALINQPVQDLKVDSTRLVRFAFFGAALGPILGRWMSVLERTIPLNTSAGIGYARTLSLRVLVDQTCM